MSVTGLIHVRMAGGRPGWLKMADAKKALRSGAATEAMLGGQWLPAAEALRHLNTRVVGTIGGGPVNRLVR